MNAHTKPEPGTALTLPNATSLSALFTKSEGLSTMLSELERAARAEAECLDATTRKGRDALKSLAYKVSQSKSELDRQGLALTEEARKQIDAVNAGRKQAKVRLDALRDEIKKPAIDWEAAEEIRIAKHKTALDAFDQGRVDAMSAADLIRTVVAEVEQIDTGESWEEFQPIAAAAKEKALSKFRADLVAAEQREAEQAELAKLRAEAAERTRKEAEEMAAREAAEAERRDAEEAERRKVEAEKAEAARREQIERERAEAAEHATREAEERAEREKRETEERHAREMAEAKEREERAAQEELNRIEAQRRADEEAAEKRRADEAHRERILKDIAEALTPIPRESIPQALLDGRVPHVKVLI
jgi:hypothetical protein